MAAQTANRISASKPCLIACFFKYPKLPFPFSAITLSLSLQFLLKFTILWGMSYKIFIDGKEGTTGLKIFERFEKRSDLEIIQIDEDKRKDPVEKARLMNQADYVFLCLPDSAAIESAGLVTNPDTQNG